MKRCQIHRVKGNVPLHGDVEGTPWEAAIPIEINEFPWDTTDSKQSTVVRSLYDDDALYLQYFAEDGHIHAETTDLNGPVWEDSCVELFAAIEPKRRPHYVNFEVNCVGTLHLGFGPDRRERDLITADRAETIQIETSVDGPTKEASPDDEEWWVAAALPFKTLAAFTGATVSPSEGTVWQGNFHRLGGTADPWFGAWSPVDTPEPDYHQPTEFGRLIFK